MIDVADDRELRVRRPVHRHRAAHDAADGQRGHPGASHVHLHRQHLHMQIARVNAAAVAALLQSRATNDMDVGATALSGMPPWG